VNSVIKSENKTEVAYGGTSTLVIIIVMFPVLISVRGRVNPRD
jgi:hypothetical protein